MHCAACEVVTDATDDRRVDPFDGGGERRRDSGATDAHTHPRVNDTAGNELVGGDVQHHLADRDESRCSRN
jgi:hypothetical protein